MRLDKKYQYISLDYITELADDDDDFVIQMIETYLSSIPENLTKLEAAINDRDGEQINFYAHKLKGSFNFIGCLAVGDVFVQIEANSVDPTNIPLIRTLLVDVKKMADNVTAELQQVLIDMNSQA